MEKDIINLVYKNTKDTILVGIPTEYSNEVLKAYYEWLYNTYNNKEIDQDDNIVENVELYTYIQNKYWSTKNSQEKLQKLLKDPSYDKIFTIYKITTGLCLKKAKDKEEIGKDEIDKYILELADSRKTVREFNKDRAKYFYESAKMNLDNLISLKNMPSQEVLDQMQYGKLYTAK